MPGQIDRVMLRDLSRSLQPKPGVIELWLPPAELNTSGTSPVREEVVGQAQNGPLRR